MTAAIPQQAPNMAVTSAVLSPTTYARLGAALGQGDYSDVEISELMGFIENELQAVVRDACTKTAIAIVARMVGKIRAAKYNTAVQIWQQLNGKNGGLGGATFHRDCAQIAANVASQHAPQQR